MRNLRQHFPLDEDMLKFARLAMRLFSKTLHRGGLIILSVAHQLDHRETRRRDESEDDEIVSCDLFQRGRFGSGAALCGHLLKTSDRIVDI
jgi:hypothetical protein